MHTKTFESLRPMLESGVPEIAERPGLLYASSELESALERLQSQPEIWGQILGDAERTLNDPDLFTVTEPYYSLGKLGCLTAAEMVQPQERQREAVLKLLRVFIERPRWVAHVHGHMKCDHCAANTAAAMTLALEALGPEISSEDEEFITNGIYEKCLRSFLESCEERSEWWALRDHPYNWRIMTCGEAGLAALGLRNLPDRLRIIEFGLEGIADILDRVPAEGDWEEGPGYWSATLFYGLRFALALRRLTQGGLDLFQHPALETSADYFIDTALPDGSVFNYADNVPTISPTPLLLLARENRLEHLVWTARKMDRQSIWDVLFDDLSLSSGVPEGRPMAKVFPTTGIAVARSDWSEEAMFVGLKSGPTEVGHSHLDIQSFVVSKGGTRLITDSGIWPYAHFLGFFDSAGPRWDFDANGTIGHNTVLVDGQGQTHGAECAGRIVASHSDEQISWFISDGSAVYPGLLDRFDRWLVFVRPDVVLIYDDLASAAPRRWEWLLHHEGTLTGGRSSHLIENEGHQLSLTRLLPEPTTPWRNSEQTRTTYYEDSNALKEVELAIHLRSFGPLFPSTEIEFLWALHLGQPDDLKWHLDRTDRSTFVVHGESSGREVTVSFDLAGRRCCSGL